MATPRSTLLIACGALAREILALRQAGGWDHLVVDCLPAHYHNTPEAIAPAVRAKIRENRARYGRIFVVYGDCGTSGALDRVLAEEGVERMPGPHCYEFYAGSAAYAAMMEAEVGTFFLTDYMVRHFDRLIIEGLWLDRHPELLDQYFGNYRKLVYLAQTEDAELQEKAAAAAARLGFAYEYRFTDFGGLADHLREVATAPVEASAARPP
ncbi:MAG: DUF1638 domain-containing protein, partial [Dongiaceae bacterium]